MTTEELKKAMNDGETPIIMMGEPRKSKWCDKSHYAVDPPKYYELPNSSDWFRPRYLWTL